MGSEEVFNAKPSHPVHLSAYLIDVFIVTNARYARFMEERGYERQECWSEEGWKVKQEEGWEKPRYWEDAPWNRPEHPVVGISWYEAEAYCKWAGKELPTEAQWEKAAKGGTYLDGDELSQEKNPCPDRKFPWGHEEPGEGGNYRCIFKDEPVYGNKSTGPVGATPAGGSPYGCQDMSGNVWEWCQDWFKRDYYKESPKDDPKGPPDGTDKVLRGGSWCRESKQLNVSFRTKDAPSNGGWDLSGFRCVKNG